jgi:hypothetical protein
MHRRREAQAWPAVARGNIPWGNIYKKQRPETQGEGEKKGGKMIGWYIAFFVWLVIVLMIGKPIVDSSIRRQESNHQWERDREGAIRRSTQTALDKLRNDRMDCEAKKWLYVRGSVGWVMYGAIAGNIDSKIQKLEQER